MKIYIAGFDVFKENAVEIGRSYKEICERYGHAGLYPLDNECDSAKEIFSGNVKLIDEADIIVANLNNFRGDEPDCGTAFELGYAYAKGKRLFGYIEDIRTLREKLGDIDKDGMAVEDFSLPVNLMIGIPTVIVQGGFEDVIKSACLRGRQNR